MNVGEALVENWKAFDFRIDEDPMARVILWTFASILV